MMKKMILGISAALSLASCNLFGTPLAPQVRSITSEDSGITSWKAEMKSSFVMTENGVVKPEQVKSATIYNIWKDNVMKFRVDSNPAENSSMGDIFIYDGSAAKLYFGNTGLEDMASSEFVASMSAEYQDNLIQSDIFSKLTQAEIIKKLKTVYADHDIASETDNLVEITAKTQVFGMPSKMKFYINKNLGNITKSESFNEKGELVGQTEVFYATLQDKWLVPNKFVTSSKLSMEVMGQVYTTESKITTEFNNIQLNGAKDSDFIITPVVE